jgi:hypothetical protein
MVVGCSQRVLWSVAGAAGRLLEVGEFHGCGRFCLSAKSVNSKVCSIPVVADQVVVRSAKYCQHRARQEQMIWKGNMWSNEYYALHQVLHRPGTWNRLD